MSALFRSLLGALAMIAFAAQAQTWNTTLHSRDVDHDGTVDAYYDSTLDITWLRDWQAVDPNFSPAPGATYDETNFFQLSLDHAANLTHLGANDWRLPRAYNFDLASRPDQAVAGSELSHLYLVTLGLQPDMCMGGPGSPGCEWVTGGPLFSWTPYDNYITSELRDGAVLGFDFGFGYGPSYSATHGLTGYLSLMTVVRDGDIAAVSAVPEPGTYLLMGLGLLAIGLHRRRRRAGV